MPRLRQSPAVSSEARDVSAGLWVWRVEYPDWRPGLDWGPLVNSTCVTSAGEGALLDPIAPPDDPREIWDPPYPTPPPPLVLPQTGPVRGRRPLVPPHRPPPVRPQP